MKTRHTLLVLLMMMATGCNDDSAEVARVAQQALRQQAEQNQEMGRLTPPASRSRRSPTKVAQVRQSRTVQGGRQSPRQGSRQDSRSRR